MNQPNRKERRALIKAARGSGVSKEEVMKFINTTEPTVQAVKPLLEGQRVKLDYERIINGADYHRLTDRYKGFVEAHREDVFTVAYDERHKDGFMVCFTEEPIWLWHVSDLVVVE